MKKKIYTGVMMALLAVVLSACGLHPENAQSVNQLPAIYPDYVDVTVPVEIAPLNFAMADDAYTDIYVDVKGQKGGSLHAEGAYADFDIDEWHQLLAANKGSRLDVSVWARKGDDWYQYRDFAIYVSSYSMDEWVLPIEGLLPAMRSMDIWAYISVTFLIFLKHRCLRIRKSMVSVSTVIHRIARIQSSMCSM